MGHAYGLKAQKAGLLGKLSNAKKCKKAWLKAVELDPENLQARVGLFNYYVQAPGIAGGGIDKAKQQANEIKKLDAFQGYYAFARIYNKEKKYDLLEAQYQAMEKEYGDSSEHFYFYNDYGYFLLNQNRIDESIEKFEKQVELAPNNANAHDSLGESYEAAGRLKEAANEYRKALELDPDFKDAEKHLKELKEREDQ
jgi:tetratricopeptide (TPR) repeat protein